MPPSYDFTGPNAEAERARMRNDYAPVRYDERGRPYRQLPGQPRKYISPVSMGTGQTPADTTGPFRVRPQWNEDTGEWETPVDWGNILTTATAAGLGYGGLNAILAGAPAAAGPAAATGPAAAGPAAATGPAAAATAASVTPATQSFPVLAATTGHLTDAAMNIGLPTVASQGISQLVNRAAPTALDMLKNTVPGVANRLSEGEDGNGLSPLLRAAINALAGIGPAIMASRTPEPSAEERALMAQAQKLQALQQQRIELQNPLFRAVTQLANSRLPTASQGQIPQFGGS